VSATPVLTYLEMRSSQDLQPCVTVAAKVDLEKQERYSPTIRGVTLQIGRRHDWPSQSWSELEWRRYLERPNLRHWLGTVGGNAVGLASLDFDPAGHVEIDTFGLLPQFQGRGLGGAFLAAVVHQAWLRDPLARRLWLHTSGQDHPHALKNYLARGFVIYRTDDAES